MLFTLIVLNFVVAETYANCYNENLFSTKTPYSLVQNLDVSIEKPLETCTPVHINMIHRHGHRYPSIKDMKNMKEVGDILNNVNPPSTTNINLPWNLPYTFEQDKILTNVGEAELFGIGKRIVARFPEIFENKYTPFNYTFQSTCKLRCTHSAISLAAGLFDGKGHLGEGKYQPVTLETHPCHSDKVLRFFDHCEKYLDHVVRKNADKEEMKKFQKSPTVTKVIDKINRKLGKMNEGAVLKPKHLKVIMVMCAYELGMHGGNMKTGICSLLDDEDHLVGEYLIDLKHFYARSAGFKVNYESACPLLDDFITTIREFALSPQNGKVGIFRSAHAETIIPLFALLNVSLDNVPMKTENFDELKVRRFRGACLSPFSGNLYFVLYNCSGVYKIQLYINERLVKMPCCQSGVDCDLETFLDHYGPLADGCHFDHICKTHVHKTDL